MSKKLIFIALFAIVSLGLYSQRPTMELTFTAIDSAAYVQLDCIRVMNCTQGGDTVLYWPDTVLMFYYVGIPEVVKEENAFQVLQNYPNPVTEQTTISLYVPERDKVSMIITDIMDRAILKSERVLDAGNHFFRFTPGSRNLYFFTAQWRGSSSSIKILQVTSHSNGFASLDYIGAETLTPQLKTSDAIQSFSFSPGDELLSVGFANGMQSGILDAAEVSQTYTFQFATNIPCLGTPTVEYEGQIYNTIQIFSQCWLKQNLNVGTMIQGSGEMTDNGIMEKYCYNNEPENCTIYGGLYQWREMMQYSTQQGVQGICPQGWHLPTGEEWKVLEGAVDSQYGIGDPEWDLTWTYRGYDAGANLKTINGWYGNGNGTDLYGFSGMPAGQRNVNGNFATLGLYSFWWTSTQRYLNHAWYRFLFYGNQGVFRYFSYKEDGFSVRCLRD